MSFWFIFLFAYNFVQIFTFLLIWSIVLLAVFRLFIYFVFTYYPQNGVSFAAVVSSLVISALLFELIRQYHESMSKSSSGFSSFVTEMYSYSSTSYQINWFGPIWRLNPFYIAATLFGEIIVVFSGVCGRSVGEYVSGIFHEQSLVTGIVSVLLTTIVIIISMFALMGYQINAGLQGITVSRSRYGTNSGRSYPSLAVK
ncbi:hypothetical protein RB195_008424 [Necator americanus]|uniref:Uncharacterized protein n=1 Tax=Necator americanus TaxID=51031 RepID=A0ABR1CNL0_NECAM